MSNQFVSKLPKTIQSERLNLRAPNMADAPALHQLANNKSIHDFLARLPHPYTRAHAVDFITNLARTKNEFAYAILSNEDDFVGVMGWHLDEEIGWELGYWIGEPFWGKGYATEAAIALVDAALKIGQKNLFARAMSKNPGSVRVLEKVGFTQISEGVDDCGVHRGVAMKAFRWEQSDG